MPRNTRPLALLVWSVPLLGTACGGVAPDDTAAHPTASAVTTAAATTSPSACSSAGVDSGWITGDLGPLSPAFAVEFDATPATTMDDALFGLSSGPAGTYSDLAAIVRFNSSGHIDARNGGSYGADAVVTYGASASQHLRFDVNTFTHTYSVSGRSPSGSGYDNGYQLGTAFAFRSEQANTSLLDHFALKVDSAGPLSVCNVAVHPCDLAVPTGGFVNHAFGAQTGSFTVTFRATPGANLMDGVVGLSSGPATTFNDIAAAIRFNPSQQIDVRKGDVYANYTADSYAPSSATGYKAGQARQVTMTVDLAAHTYSVNADGYLFAYNFPFRSQQTSVGSLDTLVLVADSAAGPVTVCDLAVAAAAPPTLTPCQSYRDCVQQGELCSSDGYCRPACDCPQCCPAGLACASGTMNGPPGEGHGTCI